MKNLNKMKIAGDMQFEIGQDKISHFPAWEVKDDKTLCKKVEELKRSTFDKSKFAVVGNPTITDDGMMNHFTYNRYARSPYYTNINSGVWEFTLWAYLGTTPGAYNMGLLDIEEDVDGSTKRTAVFWDVGKKLYFYVENIGEGNLGDIVVNTATTNKLVKIKLIINYNTSTTKVILDIDGEKYTKIANRTVSFSNTFVRAGGWNGGDDDGTYLDLKHFSITVDGVEVFNGNKTGLDVIKPDNYEVVGSPVINEGGVASGFSNSSYLRTYITLKGNTFKIRCKFSLNSIQNAKALFGYLPTYNHGWYNYCVIGTSNIFCPLQFTDQTYVQIVVKHSFIANKDYIVELEFTGTRYILSLYDSNGLINSNFCETNLKLYNYDNLSSYFNIGYAPNSNYNLSNGSIDLNAFKIYVDGNLVYQPCLKIPYTESKTGSKIVDVAYRDRVQDLFEQVGYNGYFTLGENDFTLPTHKFSDVIDCYENGINKWEQRVDRTLRQHGSCTAGTEVTLLKPYTDENYALSVPYSAKTASSFIPTVTGDWFTEGKITL